MTKAGCPLRDRLDVEAIRTAEAGKIRLVDVAEELELTYHQAYRALKALGRHHKAGSELLLDADDVQALRDATTAAVALRDRSLPQAEALVELG